MAALQKENHIAAKLICNIITTKKVTLFYLF